MIIQHRVKKTNNNNNTKAKKLQQHLEYYLFLHILDLNKQLYKEKSWSMSKKQKNQLSSK